MPMPPRKVLSVGQCGYDHGSLSRYLQSSFQARVSAADTHTQALDLIRRDGPFDLVLVNRVGDRDGAPGLDLIRSLKADPELASIPVMLVSNYESAQNDAVTLGALPGFGKSEVGRESASDRLRDALSVHPETG